MNELLISGHINYIKIIIIIIKIIIIIIIIR